MSAVEQEDVLARLQAVAPQAGPAAVPVKGYLTIRLSSAAELLPVARLLKQELGYTYLEMVTAVDWSGPTQLAGFVSSRNPNPFAEGPTPPPVAPVAAAGVAYRPVFDLLWSFGNLDGNHKLFLRLEVPRDQARVPSLTGLFPAADWQEREVFDLFGVGFTGHPNLIKILTPDFLKGHPLRKDYAHEKDEYDAD